MTAGVDMLDVSPVRAFADNYIWLIRGTSTDRVAVVDPGDATPVLETDDAAVQAVAIAKDGTVYAAAIPSGTVYRIAAGEKPAALCKLPAPDVWASTSSTASDFSGSNTRSAPILFASLRL